MTQQELNDKYGALYPYTKLAPCETADGVPFEFGMTLWWWGEYVNRYVSQSDDEIAVEPTRPQTGMDHLPEWSTDWQNVFQ